MAEVEVSFGKHEFVEDPREVDLSDHFDELFRSDA